MCELLGMSANTATDICFSFTELVSRGGGSGPHSDGWGISFYEGKAFREFKDTAASVNSEIAKFVANYPIKSHIVISHIRQANSGRVCLENTHPFSRELWGRSWVFAHNGQLKGIKKKALRYYRPIGSTDSEHAFCWMLDQIRIKYASLPPTDFQLSKFIAGLSAEIAPHGVFNFLLSDAKSLYIHCSTKLCWITRQAPFGKARLADAEVEIDFSQHTTLNDIVTVIATTPLTEDESWTSMLPGDFTVFQGGQRTYSSTSPA
ncbi:MAG: class II glutamine amidotransferase [Gammaproteobacteria bacterium]|nr:MAG: class II glutamine amidotransferase [Gammaproteobacteria bacterium]